MLLFYLRGINTINLAGLTEIVNGRIKYRRSKTGRLYSVEVLPEAQAIINKYRGTEHMLSFFDNRSNYRDFTLRMNKSLKKLGKVEIGKRGKKLSRLFSRKYQPTGLAIPGLPLPPNWTYPKKRLQLLSGMEGIP